MATARRTLIACAAGAESLSEHPIAQTIVERAQEMNLAYDSPEGFRGIAGHGVQAIYGNGAGKEMVYIGNDKLFMSEAMDLSPSIPRAR